MNVESLSDALRLDPDTGIWCARAGAQISYPADHNAACFLIENNSFSNNGNTSHIFFTWFGNTADPSTSYPRNMCVRGNTFGPTHGAYYDVNLRGEIPTSANIKVERDATLAIPSFYGDC